MNGDRWVSVGKDDDTDACRFGCKLYARKQGATIRYAIHHSLTYGHSHSPQVR